MTSNRKDDHVQLAAQQQRQPAAYNQFDDVSFVHHALAGIERSEVSLVTHVAGIEWPLPLYINAMTGGSVNTGAINRDLAIAARQTGVPIATGSMSAYLKDESTADTFSVMRNENPDGFVMANINATTSPVQARRVIDLLRADALQIHLNAIQETVMPEGDRSFGSWSKNIEEIVHGVDIPVIVKEVGFGLSSDTVSALQKMGVRVMDVGGRGGTNFARVENHRRSQADYDFLDTWGQSTPACLLDVQGLGVTVLASGGVRHPLDVVKALALGAAAVGVSGRFLATVLDGGAPALITQITVWLDQITALMTALGARDIETLTRCDVMIQGDLRAFCVDRGVDTRRLATRSTSGVVSPTVDE
ncbi:type 2 isopentenyl-diphosphate Delta-isomerase [Amycolatopsis azurea]|uniref:Isopentenyl-diphosphate delta-isomerase n=1 Tax=Amycolatopsis azurea DSM 43854 TaxID=1238180 RepID=M2NNC6_9PSEU|nr:type 2 isopentenyl-diphosphate Delta-isomerase [Amycolatopsis azurea]EMD23684.1 Isopentenyl-diphosphate delta-isomerase, FMN-dependent [Amycolatopsis azurea DSM 43854]OOC02984.1 type 2 isopentenyl-diphosphate Delta-isomerase [Amycolatopsis azurea DSM 43854]